MNARELRKAIQKVPDDMLVGSIGHYGELDTEVDYVEIRIDSRTGEKFLALVGLPASYDPPD